jgi:hypothetical protein
MEVGAPEDALDDEQPLLVDQQCCLDAFIVLDANVDKSQYKLHHLLTEESVILPSGNRYYLSGTLHTLSVRRDDGELIGLVKDLLPQVRLIFALAGTLWKEDSATGLREPVDPTAFTQVVYFRQFEIGRVRYKLVMYHCPWLAVKVWWEIRMLGSPWGANVDEFSSNVIRNQWSHWKKIVLQFIALSRGLRKSADRRGRSRHWTRHLPFPCMSTSAVLLVTAFRAVRGRPITIRGNAEEFMQGFIETFFASEAIEIDVQMDSAIVMPVLGYSPPCPDFTLAIDDGIIDFMLVYNSFGPFLQDRFGQAYASFGFAEGNFNGDEPLHLWKFLLVVFGMDVPWLTAQVFGQVSSWIDVLWKEKYFSANPLDVDEDRRSLKRGAIKDANLLNKLILGEGLGDDTTRAWQSGAHVRAFQALTPAGKRMKTLHPQEMAEGLMLQVLQVSQVVLATARHINTPLDGSRCGYKDANFIAVGGFCNGTHRVAWSPVMVGGVSSSILQTICYCIYIYI